MAPSPVDKQPAGYKLPHDWLVSLAMELATVCDMWRVESLCYVYSVPHPPNCSVLFVTDDVISVTKPITVSINLQDIHSNPIMNQAENLDLSSDQGDNFIVSTTVRELSPGVL